jgi:hypothetical protein
MKQMERAKANVAVSEGDRRYVYRRNEYLMITAPGFEKEIGDFTREKVIYETAAAGGRLRVAGESEGRALPKR